MPECRPVAHVSTSMHIHDPVCETPQADSGVFDIQVFITSSARCLCSIICIALNTVLVFTGCAYADQRQTAPIRSQDEIRIRGAAPIVTIPQVDHPPRLSDFISMKPDSNAPHMQAVSNFIEQSPKDGAPSQGKTVVYIGYDSKNLYAVFVCFDDQPKKIRARMTRREDIGSDHDEVQLYLDTFNDRRRAYGFMINPLGVQLDYIWTDTQGYDSSWDTVWDSSGKVTGQGYVAMMSIPFKSLRFPKTREQDWGIIFQRVIPYNNDNSFYPYISVAIQGRLRQEAELKGLHNINPGHGLQLNPYGVTDAFRLLDQRNPNLPFFDHNHLGGTMGLDGKAVIHNSLVLDFTINPDFRQLESDEPQNLVNQRFEVLFPEKRPFFQEGANFFQTPINLYFTRRIEDPSAGLRLTGKLGNWGIGLLASDDRSPGRFVPDQDPLRRKRAYFSVARFTREFGDQSHIGVFYSDREMGAVAPERTLCDDTALTTTEEISCISHSNRVAGADFRWQAGNHFHTEGQAVASSTDEAGGTHLAGSMYDWYAKYSDRHIDYNIQYQNVSPGFVTLMGFFQRPDVISENQFGIYLFRPEGRLFTDFGPQLVHEEEWDHEGNRLDRKFEPAFRIDLKQNTNINIWHGFRREQLRSVDFSQLKNNVDFPENYNGIVVSNNYLRFLTFNGFLQTGKIPNFNPPNNVSPFLANEVSSNVTASFHIWNPLTWDNSYILERLTSRTVPAHAIVNAHIIRTKLNYQYNLRLSFRAIFQYNSQLVNPLYTSLATEKRFNGDFLLTYLVHPGTAFYIGYNSNLENLNPLAITTHTGLFRTQRSYINDGRVVFAKVAWLFRF